MSEDSYFTPCTIYSINPYSLSKKNQSIALYLRQNAWLLKNYYSNRISYMFREFFAKYCILLSLLICKFRITVFFNNKYLNHRTVRFFLFFRKNAYHFLPPTHQLWVSAHYRCVSPSLDFLCSISNLFPLFCKSHKIKISYAFARFLWKCPISCLTR